MSGDIAESISMILERNVMSAQIYGSDIRPDLINTNLCASSFMSPSADDPTFFQWLTDVLSKNKFEFYIPCSEDELLVISNFSDIQLANINSLTKIVWAGASVIKRLASKSNTSSFLNSINLNPPKLFSKYEEIIDFPVVVKPDVGRGSKNIFVCLDQLQVKAALALVENSIIQEYIPSPESEYTCVVYRNFNFATVCIVFHRYLSGGLTSWAEVVNDPAIKNICVRIADELDLTGSINIQLRKSKDRIAVFEINPRFSSTVFMRSLVNFNDLLWSLEIGNPAEEYFEEMHFGAKFKVVKTANRIK
jgi:carbamoyl-phosphate synthase large subunit